MSQKKPTTNQNACFFLQILKSTSIYYHFIPFFQINLSSPHSYLIFFSFKTIILEKSNLSWKSQIFILNLIKLFFS